MTELLQYRNHPDRWRDMEALQETAIAFEEAGKTNMARLFLSFAGKVALEYLHDRAPLQPMPSTDKTRRQSQAPRPLSGSQ